MPPPQTTSPSAESAPHAVVHATDWPRFLRQSLGFWLVMAVYVPAMLTLLLLTWGRAAHTSAPRLVRWWGRTMLRNVGVRLVLEPALVAELAVRRRRVLTFNHASTMDIMLISAIWPDGAVAVVKREMLWIPLMGQLIYFLNFLPLHRGDRARASASLRAAAQRMRQHELTVMLAPEGTRSPSGGVETFKLGAFHLAAAADAPILPLVLHGTRQLWPRWQRHCAPGVVTARLLSAEPSGAGGAPDGTTLRSRAEALRQRYVTTLAAMDAELPPR